MFESFAAWECWSAYAARHEFSHLLHNPFTLVEVLPISFIFIAIVLKQSELPFQCVKGRSGKHDVADIRKTYILLYRALSCFFLLFLAFSCFSVKAREKYNKSNPPYFSECLGIWLKK